LRFIRAPLDRAVGRRRLAAARRDASNARARPGATQRGRVQGLRGSAVRQTFVIVASASGMQRQLSLKDVGLLRHSVRTLLEVDRAQVQPWRGLRLALGVAIPLIGGIATGHEDLGAFACGGALGVGFGGCLGAYRTQAVTMMVAAACIALALFVGSIGMHPTVLAAGIVALGGFAAGLLGVFGPGAYFVG